MIRANKFFSFGVLCILLGGTVLTAETAKPVVAAKPVAPSSMNWQSLGFSADGKFYATITYGVEHELKRSESHFFARLQVQYLGGGNSEIVLERLLRRSLPLDSGVFTRSIMVDLLRKEARELYNFEIDSLVQGEILFSEKEADRGLQEADNEVLKVDSEMLEADSEMLEADSEMLEADSEMQKEVPKQTIENPKQDVVGVAMAELVSALDEGDNVSLENPTYIARRNADTTVFYLRRIEMDGERSLRGQLVVAQSGAFPRRYAFQRSWNSLLANSAKNPALQPIFVSLSPDTRHLVMVFKLSSQIDIGYGGNLEQNNSQEFVTLALTVY